MDDFFILKRFERNFGGLDGFREDGVDDWFFIVFVIEGCVGIVFCYWFVIDVE